MGWTSPRTWTNTEDIDEAIMNAHVRGNLLYLKDSWVDDTPVNGETTVPVSSNWAYNMAILINDNKILALLGLRK